MVPAHLRCETCGRCRVCEPHRPHTRIANPAALDRLLVLYSVVGVLLVVFIADLIIAYWGQGQVHP